MFVINAIRDEFPYGICTVNIACGVVVVVVGAVRCCYAMYSNSQIKVIVMCVFPHSVLITTMHVDVRVIVGHSSRVISL